MDNNNMNVVDFNNMNQQGGQNMNQNMGPVQPVGPQPVPPVNPVEPQPVPTMEQNVGSVPTMNPVEPQPMSTMNQNMEPVQPVGQQPVQPMVNPTGEVPVINVEQTPTEVFGQSVNPAQVNDPTQMNQMVQSINVQQQPEAPKYGYTTTEQKTDLNSDSNINLKIVIFLAILIGAFIFALPYLSDMLDK